MGFRDAAAIAVVLVMVLSAVPLAMSDGTDAVPEGRDCDGVLIYEVAAKFGSSNEGFSLKNYGSSAVNLNGYYLYDNESTDDKNKFTITSSLTIDPGKIVTFVKTKNSEWFCESSPSRTVYEYGDKSTADPQFTFANAGDKLQLYSSSGTFLDMAVYGTATSSSDGWKGDAADLGNVDEAIRRVESKDTDTYFDWTPIADGYTANGFDSVPTFSDAKVTPFIFPDSKGRPIFDAIMAAENSVHISIYMLTSKEMISELAYLASNGKDIKVMLENKPLGYDHNYADLENIVYSGGEVVFIGDSSSGTDRYSYVHNKYAVIDGKKVIVTSENWTAANLGAAKGNRGWGAVVESAGYASYMETYFNNDFTGKDILTFAGYEAAKGDVERSVNLPTHSQVVSYVDGLSYSASTYTATVKMYMSPDNTFKALQSYMDSASTRIYTEQMDVGANYMNLDNTSPLSAMVSAAKRGVDCRFLLSESTEDAKTLVANGCFAVCEGANMPTTLDATKYLQENGVLFSPGKASNAGGVATSALEMSQNSERLSWTFEEVDAKLKGIMVNIFHACDDASKQFGMEGNYVAGANIAGFLKVANAMKAQGIV